MLYHHSRKRNSCLLIGLGLSCSELIAFRARYEWRGTAAWLRTDRAAGLPYGSDQRARSGISGVPLLLMIH